ncbi:hypothetical protein [Synechococcus sp. MIT S9510]|uniref:hypothetical protein n=1 Tax=unclassified Synechococcus TaxID=2626047 RepID=UPI0039B00B0F
MVLVMTAMTAALTLTPSNTHLPLTTSQLISRRALQHQPTAAMQQVLALTLSPILKTLLAATTTIS